MYAHYFAVSFPFVSSGSIFSPNQSARPLLELMPRLTSECAGTGRNILKQVPPELKASHYSLIIELLLKLLPSLDLAITPRNECTQKTTYSRSLH